MGDGADQTYKRAIGTLFLFTSGLLPSPDGAQLGTLHLIQKDLLSIFLNVTDSSMIHGYFKF